MAHNNWLNSNVPTKVKKLIFKMKQGEVEDCHTMYKGKKIVSPTKAIKIIKDTLNYDINYNTYRMQYYQIRKEEDIYRAKGKHGKRWSSAADKLCTKLFQSLPPRASQDDWERIVFIPMDNKFPVRKYNRACINSRMTKLGIKRTNTRSNLTSWQTFEQYAELAKESGWELIEWMEGSRVWIVKCLSCENIQIKHNFGSIGGRNCLHCHHKKMGKHVGGKPQGNKPALVYLLDFNGWKKCKLGYAALGGLSPIEAIHRTSKPRKYPYPYEIIAYDLSTETEAADYEEILLDDTYDTSSFIETQEFDGWTEFRTRETIEELREMGAFRTWLK